MKCRQCGQTDTRVIDTRAAEQGRETRRRRQCPACGYRWTTYEIPGQFLKRKPLRESPTS